MNKLSIKFFTYYFVYFGSLPMFTLFIPIFLKNKGFTQTKIGILLSLAQIIGIGAMPFWANITDKSKSKNNVLKGILICSAIAMFTFSKMDNEYFLYILYGLFAFFNCALIFLGDTITLEVADKNNLDYGKIRIGGTLGFSVFAIVAGKIASIKLDYVFIAYVIVIILSIGVLSTLPKVEGHGTKKNKGNVGLLLKNKSIRIVLFFNAMIFITIAFYNSFFSIYFNELTGDSLLMGVAFFMAAFTEMPFLLKSKYILKKMGPYKLMMSGLVVTCVRWIIMSFNYNPYMAILLQCLHGWGFIVFTYVMINYVYNNVPKELRASGQSLVSLSGAAGVSGIIGNQLGGYLSDVFGVRNVFLGNGIFLLGVIILMMCFYPRDKACEDGM
ncbi:MAG: MFS transporter [Anaeromicrobium sp.]|uniref:MFS transporter n=1 Tax=Anaeromicrobium sp. TaxID=1929132 RepID=UPI0025FBDD6F|nr:MFS transporter [Anaeromicrobium sp.]MCT4596244.1 MFS transporter [Anaeromicrobium sp.]